MARARRPQPLRIQNWIRNWIAGSRPCLPPPGSVRATSQMLADRKAGKPPCAVYPGRGSTQIMASTENSPNRMKKTHFASGTVPFACSKNQKYRTGPGTMTLATKRNARTPTRASLLEVDEWTRRLFHILQICVPANLRTQHTCSQDCARHLTRTGIPNVWCGLPIL